MRPHPIIPALVLFASTLSAQVTITPSTFPNHDALVSINAGGACAFFFDSVFDIDTYDLGTRVQGAFGAERYLLFLVEEDETVFDTAYASSHTAITGSAGVLDWTYDRPIGGYPLDPGSLGSCYLPYDESYEDYSLLFAFWDDRADFGGGGAPGVVKSSDLFGWMRVGFTLVEDTDSGLPVVQWSILNSAIAHGGVIVGQIPEPGTFSLLAGAAALTTVTTTRRRRLAHSAFARS